jgi:small conductance mechanosensitive channel
MENIFERLMEWGALYGTKVIGAVVILVVGRLLTTFFANLVERLMEKSRADRTLTGFVRNLTRISLLVFTVIAALGALGVETTSLIAVIGAVGLAVGFALQSSLSNIASGIMLVVFQPFKVGNYIKAGGTSGVVEQIRIFSTILRTFDNCKVVVPNSRITTDNINNYSAKETRRIDLEFSISYRDDLKLTRNILEGIVKADERILKDPAPEVGVLELGESSVSFFVRPWVKAGDYWPVKCDLLEKVKLTFDDEGISIPFPQRDVHLYQATAV